MIQHLDRVLAELRLEEPDGARIDLRRVFANVNGGRAV
jgi:hypothetical protein